MFASLFKPCKTSRLKGHCLTHLRCNLASVNLVEFDAITYTIQQSSTARGNRNATNKSKYINGIFMKSKNENSANSTIKPSHDFGGSKIQDSQTNTPVFLTARRVREITGLSESTIRRLRFVDDFPSPIRLTPSIAGHLRWYESEILDWLESRRRA